MKRIFPLKAFRIMALVILIAGAVVSVALTRHAGRHNKSVILPLMFISWVLSPFIALLVANSMSARWPVTVRVILYFLMILIAIGSLVVYSGIFSSAGAKPAGVFLIVPLLSWLLIVIVIPVTLVISRRNNKN